jgi:hypothetical protein
VPRIYAMLRIDRAECGRIHDPECHCTIWRLPKIRCHTLDELKERLGAEVVEYYSGKENHVEQRTRFFDEEGQMITVRKG